MSYLNLIHIKPVTGLQYVIKNRLYDATNPNDPILLADINELSADDSYDTVELVKTTIGGVEVLMFRVTLSIKGIYKYNFEQIDIFNRIFASASLLN